MADMHFEVERSFSVSFGINRQITRNMKPKRLKLTAQSKFPLFTLGLPKSKGIFSLTISITLVWPFFAARCMAVMPCLMWNTEIVSMYGILHDCKEVAYLYLRKT